MERNSYRTRALSWEHQDLAYHKAVNQPAYGIFMGMGTGKTKVAADILANRGHKLILIVCPKSVLIDGLWERELLRFGAFEMDPWIITLDKGTAKDKAETLIETVSSWKRHCPLIFILNYETAWRKPLDRAILRYQWDCLILDEAHRIKAAGSKVSRFFARANKPGISRQRLALTGTPLPNSPLDAYGLYRFLDPSIFGTRFDVFRDHYAVMGGYSGYQVLYYKNQEELREKMASISLRVSEEVLKLPPYMDLFRNHILSGESAKLYRELAKDMIANLQGGTVSVPNILVKLIRLQQICSGFIDDDEGNLIYLKGSNKLFILREVLEDLDRSEPLVIFCKFTREIKLVSELLRELGISYGELSGNRNDLEKWKTSELLKALVVQISAGSEGIDLTKARYLIYYNKPYSYGIYAQSQRRIHRPGQERTVFAVHIQAIGTIEEDIYDALSMKKNLIEYLIEKEKSHAP